MKKLVIREVETRLLQKFAAIPPGERLQRALPCRSCRESEEFTPGEIQKQWLGKLQTLAG